MNAKLSIDWEQLLSDCVQFTQKLIQTPSMTYEEATIGEVVMDELLSRGFDEVWRDEVGNVYGRVFGRNRDLPAIVLNSHLDHVDIGDPALWQHPPFAGEIVDGEIIGRGATDIKGPLAVQLYSIVALLRAGVRPQHTVVFSAVVEEELGGTGMRHWVKTVDYPIEMIVLGEPSSNQIAVGHRGIKQIWVTFYGRSAHASAPQRAINPNYALAQFLVNVQAHQHELGEHPHLGKTTVSPTVIEVDTTSINVTPAWARVCLDFRTATESTRSLEQFIGRIAPDCPYILGDAREDDPATPLILTDTTITGFDTNPINPRLQKAHQLISEGMGYTPELICYQFATDGRHATHLGAPIFGYSPSDEDQAHVADEKISIEKMRQSLLGHAELLWRYE